MNGNVNGIVSTVALYTAMFSCQCSASREPAWPPVEGPIAATPISRYPRWRSLGGTCIVSSHRYQPKAKHATKLASPRRSLCLPTKTIQRDTKVSVAVYNR